MSEALVSSIDIRFNFETDANGQDPDSHSPTLRRYHKMLWSKPLPDGREFNLDDATPGAYLHHRSNEVGEFFLASDSAIHTFRRWERTAPLIARIPEEEIDSFYNLACTIGAMLIFPGNKIDGRMTINGARGFNLRICDRLDLTLESIRRYYAGEESPLAETLTRYESFFRLFGDFGGYVEFFLLHDLVDEQSLEVSFFTDDFDDFTSSPLPGDVATYRTYMNRSMRFVRSRNRRIQDWAELRL